MLKLKLKLKLKLNSKIMFKIKFQVENGKIQIFDELNLFNEFNEFNEIYNILNYDQNDFQYYNKTSFFKETFAIISKFSYNGKINIDNKSRTIVNISNGKKNGKLLYFKLGKINQMVNFLNDKLNSISYDYDDNGNVYCKYNHENDILNYMIEQNFFKIKIEKRINEKFKDIYILFDKNCKISEVLIDYEGGYGFEYEFKYIFDKNYSVKCFNKNILSCKLTYKLIN